MESGRRRLAITALAAAAALACSRPDRAAEAPPPSAHLARVPDGAGQPFRAEARLSVRDRHLILPDGQPCLPADAGCASRLQALEGKRLSLEISKDLLMADLSEALATLASALPPDGTACLEVADSRSLRCLPIHPFGAEEFGDWLDADKPIGKVRIILRSDGMEVVTRRGKMPGPDKYGPSLPPIEGKPDVEGLAAAARKLAARFEDEREVALAPTGGTRVETVARSLAALCGPDAENFEILYLVYP